MSRAFENRKFGESLEKTLKKISKDCIPPTSLSILQISVLLDISQSLAIIADNLAREDEQNG